MQRITGRALFVIIRLLLVAPIICRAPDSPLPIFQSPPLYTFVSPSFIFSKTLDPVKTNSQCRIGIHQSHAIRVYNDCKKSVVKLTHPFSNMDTSFTRNFELSKVIGSGIVWDGEGHILTNFHVVDKVDTMKVVFWDQQKCMAKVIGYDSFKDVAVLKLEENEYDNRELVPVTKGKSNSLRIGQYVYAIGNPYGLDNSLSKGIICGLNRTILTPTISVKDMIQTDAAINPGCSGSVLLDIEGRMIGMNTALVEGNIPGVNSGISFAIPIDTISGLVTQILAHGEVCRPIIGIIAAPPSILFSKRINGVLVHEVIANCPAEAAGLRPESLSIAGTDIRGDIILRADGMFIRNYTDLVDILDRKRESDIIHLEIKRNDTIIPIDIKLAKRSSLPIDL